jgi:hypothetical protein
MFIIREIKMPKKIKNTKKNRVVIDEQILNTTTPITVKPTLENETINLSSKITEHIRFFIFISPLIFGIALVTGIFAAGSHYAGEIIEEERVIRKKHLETIITTNEIKISDDFSSIGQIESYNRVKKTFDSHPTKLTAKNKDSFYIDALYKNVNPKSEIFINDDRKLNTVACFKTVENIKCYKAFSYEKNKPNKE